MEVTVIPVGGSSEVNVKEFDLLVIDGNPAYGIDNVKIPIVVIAPSDPVALYDHGADLVLGKPLAANTFMARIKSVLRRYDIDF